MDDFQLTYPWSHPFPSGLIMLGLGLCFILGIYLFYLVFKSTKTIKKAVLTFISIPLIGLPTINFIGYQNHVKELHLKYSGKYINQEASKELNLLRNDTWISHGLNLECKTGKWELQITEDGTYIELSCDAAKYPFEQLWPSRDLEVMFDNKIELKKNKK